jgi:hypothetical protein
VIDLGITPDHTTHWAMALSPLQYVATCKSSGVYPSATIPEGNTTLTSEAGTSLVIDKAADGILVGWGDTLAEVGATPDPCMQGATLVNLWAAMTNTARTSNNPHDTSCHFAQVVKPDIEFQVHERAGACVWVQEQGKLN